ncbi:hypothetical protein ECANGB1_1479 [Enterospora canceri]|uniref:N-acetyltransferase domain-containing protein n=1 Tax=Enterospora canceri TaxID=1081671 RepID=A0A1Y1S6N7_9MICR|nr:hypothetical protein ECANGB1_1479 [Enterospora canceri]
MCLSDLYSSMILEQKYFNDSARMCDEMHDRIVTINNYFYIARNTGNKIIGLLKADLRENSMITVYVIVVEREYRRHGIGKSLFNRLFNDIKHLIPVTVELYVNPVNSAIEFYKRIGFIKEGVIHHFYKSGESAFKMQLRLTK